MVIKIPQNNKFPQINRGDNVGTLLMTRNVDLNTPGVIKLAQRTSYVGQTSSGNFTDTRAIEHFRTKYWIASDRMYSLDGNLTNLTEDTGTAPVTSISDLTVWGLASVNLYASDATRIHQLGSVPGTWLVPFSTSNFGNTTLPHPIEGNVTNANILAGDGPTLKIIDNTGVMSSAFTLPGGNMINWIRRGNGVNYIGFTPFTFVGDGYPSTAFGGVAIWDGLPTTISYNSIIPLNCRAALSAVVDDKGVLWIFTSDGRLMKFNGTAFDEVAEVPAFRDFLARRSWGGTPSSLLNQTKVFQRGMKIIRGKIHISINATTTTQIMQPEFQSGVWVYDPDNGAFYLKHTISNSNTGTDFGQSLYSDGPGAIFPVIEYNQGETGPSDSVGGVLLTGCRLYPNTVAGTALRTLVSVATGTNRGQFSTTEIVSDQITDNNVAIWCKYRGVLTANDKILFKYRTDKINPFVINNTSATWTSTTVFTSTDTKLANALMGDEVTILTGTGAGSTAHVSSISLNTGTYTVTLDEAITGILNNDTSMVMFDRWEKTLITITSADTRGYKRIPIDIGNSKSIEIKVEMRGEGGVVGIEELSLVNKLNQPIN